MEGKALIKIKAETIDDLLEVRELIDEAFVTRSSKLIGDTDGWHVFINVLEVRR